MVKQVSSQVQRKQSSGGKEVPAFVKVISVLTYISAGFFILGAIFLMISSGLLASLIPILAFFSTFAILVGIGMIGFAVLLFFVARGLWKGKSWARIVAIILYSISAILAIWSLISGISFSLILNSVVSLLFVGYLLFSKKVKEAFS